MATRPTPSYFITSLDDTQKCKQTLLLSVHLSIVLVCFLFLYPHEKKVYNCHWFEGKIEDTAQSFGSVGRANRTNTARRAKAVSCSSTLSSTNQLDRDTRKARKSIWESNMNRFKTSKFKNTTPKVAKKEVSSEPAFG